MYIDLHAYEVLWRWSAPLPRLENVVLNSTGVALREVVALASLMPALRELHICCNYYQDLGNIEAAINEGALAKLECLRLNENIITSWAEVWKLRGLPALKQLILSENPLCDVFYSSDSKEDLAMFDLDIFDNTCYSDGEDSSFGKCATKVVPEGSYCSKAFFSEADGSVSALATSADKVALANDGVLKDRVILQNINMCSTVITDQNKTKTEEEHDLKQEVLYQQNNAASQQDKSKLQLPCSILKWHPSVVYELLDEIVFSAWQHVIGEQKLHATGRLRKKPAIDCVTKDEEKTNQQETNRMKLQASGVILDVVNNSVNGRPTEAYSSDHNKCTTKLKLSPFEKLDTLCLSRTSICEVKHLQALNQFPQLKSLKIMEIALFSDVRQEDRRKLFVASLPGIKVLNGSEITPTEREKAERHYLRHFLNNQEKALRYKELVAKHGPIQPLLDIDLGVRFQKDATLTFVLCGVKEFQETVSVLQPVGKLRTMVAERLAIPWKSFRMFHFACGPHQQEQVFDELFLDSLPLSRFDFMDGDEIHIEFIEDTEVNPVLSSRRYPRLKEVDDVLGGAAAWENVDSTESYDCGVRSELKDSIWTLLAVYTFIFAGLLVVITMICIQVKVIRIIWLKTVKRRPTLDSIFPDPLLPTPDVVVTSPEVEDFHHVSAGQETIFF
ncbi:hypothetical protein C0Q70_07553 [Pomacea canaliculata]|uniref:Ubiquitin-like domain-containing protein n=1 Tax=Pomacea canaliculata TaxID=400727 RepID=A0A2T7PFC2_POMCA|nr:hypothetical protein C0Q70_07553 [Pomacea canaliculata]